MGQGFDFNFQLPASPDANIQDPAAYKELLIIYNSMRLIADQFSQQYARVVQFSMLANVGDIVSIYDVSGAPWVRFAQYNVYRAHGFVSVPPTAINGYGEIKIFGMMPSFSFNVAPSGTVIFVSSIPGAIAGSNPGPNSQRIGYFVSQTDMFFNALAPM